MAQLGLAPGPGGSAGHGILMAVRDIPTRGSAGHGILMAVGDIPTSGSAGHEILMAVRDIPTSGRAAGRSISVTIWIQILTCRLAVLMNVFHGLCHCYNRTSN